MGETPAQTAGWFAIRAISDLSDSLGPNNTETLMTKITHCILMFVMLSVQSSSFARATYGFFNYVASVGLDAPVFDTAGNRLSGSDYLALLYGGPTADDLHVARDSSISVPMEPVAFTYHPNGQTGYFGDPGYVQIDTVPCNGFAWLQVRVWDARRGNTYDEVASLGMGGYGESSLFYARGGDGCSGSGISPRPLIGLQSFSLHPVPEPSTWALLGVGAGFLFWRWRPRE
jgi:hypothetical protein